MRKILLLACLIIATTSALFPAGVSVQSAQTVAINFFKLNAVNFNLKTKLTATLEYTKTERNGSVDFYVFGFTPVKGFVIVTADDNLEPVIGFSTESNFSANFTNTGVNDWVGTVSGKIVAALNAGVTADDRITSLWSSYAAGVKPAQEEASSVGPLAPTTWDQENDISTPPPYIYNLLCPFNTTDNERAVTGCVATAMAQVMAYWAFPATGTGSYSYTSANYGVQSANFGATTYPWSSMPSVLTDATTASQDSMVDIISYQCGVAVAMDYGDDKQGGSGAWVIQSDAGTGNPCAQQAYVKYFGYNASTIQGLHASSYSASAWQTLIENELNAGRVVEYAGWDVNGAGGHTWVCDGYNTSGMFHMNWGWGGIDNGFFSLSALNVDGYEFNSNDEALIGIQPGSCSQPSGLSATNISATGVSLLWQGITGATSYVIQYRPVTSATWLQTTSSSNSVGLSGLSSNTTYQWEVQTVCSAGTGTAAAGPNFTTLSPCNVTVAPTATPAAICSGGSTTLAANTTTGSGTITTYAWSSGLSGNVSGGSVSPSGNTTYTVTVTTSTGCTATGSVAVSVNAKPTVQPSASPTAICSGGSTTLAANAGAGSGTISSYSWSSGLTGNVSGGSVSPTINTTYTVTITNSNGCATSGSIGVTVNANPTVQPSANPTAICSGGSTTLAANAGAGSGTVSSYAWSSGLTGNISGGSVSPTANTTYTVTVTNSNNCAASGSTSVTVNANPIVTAVAAPSAICSGGSTTLATNAGAGSGTITSYAWSSGLTGNVTGGSVSPTVNTTYTVTVTNSNNCASIGTATVTVNANPSLQPSASPTAICSGGSTTLAANAGAGSGTISSYAWSSGLTGSVAGGSVSPSANTTYTVVVTNSNNCTTGGSVSVTVNANPFLQPSASPTSICSGGSATLSANAGAGSGTISSYTWSSDLSGNIPGGSVSPSANTTYTVVVTNSNNCTASGSTSVTVNANPIVQAVATPSAICSGDSATLATNAGAGSGTITSYAWNNGFTGNVTGGSVSPTVNTTYSVTVTNSNNCTASDSTAVTVNANPTANAFANPSVICNGSNADLITNAGAGSGSIVSYTWSSGISGNVSEGNVSPTANTTYTVTITNSNGCSASGSVAVTVNASPTVAPGATPASICSGTSTTLAANAATDSSSISTYAWSSGLTGNVSGGSVSPETNTTYMITVTNSNGCQTLGSVTVFVNAIPSATITASGPTTICSGNSVTLSVTAGALYTWSNGGTGSSITVTAAGSYSVSVTSTAGCSAVSSATKVVVDALPTATITASGAVAFCPGGSVVFTAKAGTGYKFLWSTGSTSNVITATTAGSYTYTVTNASGCSKASAAKKVTIDAVPAATIKVTKNTVCKNGTAILTATAGTGYTYDWSTGKSTKADTVNAAGTYDVIITNSDKCSASASTAITCADELVDKTDNNGNDGDNITTSTPQTLSSSGLDVSVYPNPYSSQFHLKVVSANTDNINVMIYDITGQLLEVRKAVAYGSEVILGNGYANGVYIVQVQQGESSRQVRVVKTE